MTDKEILEVLIAEIKRRKSLADKQKNNGYFFARSDAYAELLNFIDPLQTECQQVSPVGEPIDFEQELYRQFGQVKDFTLCMRIAKRFYEIGRNHPIPTSNALEEEIRMVAGDYEQVGVPWNNDFDFIAHHFADWQRKRITENNLLLPFSEYDNLLESINRQKKEGYLAGFKQGTIDAKDKLMKSAINGVYSADYAQIITPTNLFKGLKDGDKVKLIIIKEQ